MKIVLFGGAFNPPHIGHLLIAQQTLDFTDADEVWFLPNYGQHPSKPDVASFEHRLAVTKLLVLPKTRVSTIEMDHKLDGNTINLLPHLPKEHEYVFLIGSDQLPVFHLWGKWHELLKQLPFLVFPRAGFPTRPLYENMRVVAHDLLIITDLSATKIRARLKKGLPIDQFVPKEVVTYIKDHKLYI